MFQPGTQSNLAKFMGDASISHGRIAIRLMLPPGMKIAFMPAK
jgi:hypothetical protein